MLTRRNMLRLMGTSATISLAAPYIACPAFAAETIRLASLHDLSGGLEIFGQPMLNSLTMAVEEINAAGGLLNRQVELISYDTQSQNQLYTQYANRAALDDQAAVTFGGITSASREAIRPILAQNKALYFYNTYYEGGVCDGNTYCTGTTPAHTVSKLVPYAMEKFGKKVFVLAADYNYGHTIAQWAKKIAADNGGAVVEVAYFPLDVSNFGTIIAKIQQTSPDIVWHALVGGSHMAFFRQWKAAGMTGKIPVVSTTFGGGEIRTLTPEETEGVMVSQGYFHELDTPANRDFVGKYQSKFDKTTYLNELVAATYQGAKLWAAAVEKAGSTAHDDVVKALDSPVSIAGPAGTVTIDPATHHCVQDVHVAEAKAGAFSIIQSFAQQSTDNSGGRCDLRANPADSSQYNFG
jgi:urea transport system substrate-binding protein